MNQLVISKISVITRVNRLKIFIRAFIEKKNLLAVRPNAAYEPFWHVWKES